MVCYARVGDEPDFSRLIIELLQDEARRRELGQAARLRLDTALSWRDSSRNMIELMESFIGSSQAPLREPLVLDKPKG